MVTRIGWEYLELVGSSFDSGTLRDIQKRRVVNPDVESPKGNSTVLLVWDGDQYTTQMAALNRRGAEGWELIAEDHRHYSWILKRIVADGLTDA